MEVGISKPPSRSCRVKLNAAFHAELLRAISRSREVRAAAEVPSTDTPPQGKKRQLDEVDSNQSPTKRGRYTQAAAAQVEAEGGNAEPSERAREGDRAEKVEQAAEVEQAAQQVVHTVLEQPKPVSHMHSYASFLEHCVDPVHQDSSRSLADPLVSQWLESIPSPTARPKSSRSVRSDSSIYCLNDMRDDDLLSRKRPKSLPSSPLAPFKMGLKADADGFVRPPTPASVVHSVANTTQSSSRTSKAQTIEPREYREENLAANKMVIRRDYEKLPDAIADLVREIRKDRTTPEPSVEAVRSNGELNDLEIEGLDESKVAMHFMSKLLPDPSYFEGLACSVGLPMKVTPGTEPTLKITNPKPDALYGYKTATFSYSQKAQLRSTGCLLRAVNTGLAYPFFLVEFKGFGGELFVATNQCIGASVACLSLVEELQGCLPKSENGNETNAGTVDNAIFSVAMNATEARLYVTWKEEIDGDMLYVTQKVDCFRLQKYQDYIELRRLARNITDWGLNKRLNDIRKLLDVLAEKERLNGSNLAKSRQPPSEASVASSSKKQKR
ncbi:hypothetical protein F5Y17DRAFT_475874 [Xylariaceae sp. FL0594]|nr:hypothetical protein F5Y17DRAFT_475874 [Xylariaceae sp. FL0594]